MLRLRFPLWLPFILCLSLVLNGCYQPPYNNFRTYHRGYRDAAIGGTVGGLEGAFLAGTVSGAVIGAGAGAVVFTAHGMYKETKKEVIRYLQTKGDIRFEQYGDTMELIVPTDRYFYFNSTHFNPLCYHALMRIVKLLKFYPNRIIYIAGFTDSVGSRYHKNMLSQGRAETMLTFLWAHGIPARLLHAEGYGQKFAVGDNRLIRGSAFNRRLEIQWYNGTRCCTVAPTSLPPMK